MKNLIGNAVVGQSGGPTAAINATLAGVIRGFQEGLHGGKIGKLYGMRQRCIFQVQVRERCTPRTENTRDRV